MRRARTARGRGAGGEGGGAVCELLTVAGFPEDGWDRATEAVEREPSKELGRVLRERRPRRQG